MALLREREQCVCHLTEALDVKQSAVSHRTAVLKRAGLVVDRRDETDARWVYYSLYLSPTYYIDILRYDAMIAP